MVCLRLLAFLGSGADPSESLRAPFPWNEKTDAVEARPRQKPMRPLNLLPQNWACHITAFMMWTRWTVRLM